VTQGDSYQASYARQKAAKGEINFSQHAMDQMGDRKIWIDEVYTAIANGLEIELQTFEDKDVRVLFQESTEKIPRFAVVVAVDYPEVNVVTVFRFEDEDKYEYNEKIMCWRRKK